MHLSRGLCLCSCACLQKQMEIIEPSANNLYEPDPGSTVGRGGRFKSSSVLGQDVNSA